MGCMAGKCGEVSFNSRAREGRDLLLLLDLSLPDVSTHAPARGATSQLVAKLGIGEFQLTRPRGARLGASWTERGDSRFQLTRPRGARQLVDRLIQYDDGFQLTRPRGARRLPRLRIHRIIGFQLTRPRGARLPGNSAVIMSHPFQLTRPRGARRVGDRLRHNRVRFQLTRPRGARRSQDLGEALPHGFQLTRPRGARPQPAPLDGRFMCFNSRAREGRDHTCAGSISSSASFNSRAREGRDDAPRCPAKQIARFQLTRPRGARPKSQVIPEKGSKVSTHAPARGAT